MANVPFSLIWQCFDSLTNSPGQPEGGGVGGGGEYLIEQKTKQGQKDPLQIIQNILYKS